MATLSFNCPKCNRTHDRIKPEMAGYKVRCQCGFVFRLGPKSAKNKSGFYKAIKSKRKPKFDRQNRAYRNRKALSSAISELNAPGYQELFGDEILSVIPEDPLAVAKDLSRAVDDDSNPQRFQTDHRPAKTLLAGRLDDGEPYGRVDGGNERVVDAEVVELMDGFPQPPEALPLDALIPESIPAAVPFAPPPSVTTVGPLTRRRENVTAVGAVWTLVLASIGCPLMLAIVVFLGFRIPSLIESVNRREEVTGFISVALLAMAFLTALTVTVLLASSGVMAVKEILSGRKNLVLIKWAGIASLVMLACYLAMFVLVVVELIIDSNVMNGGWRFSEGDQQPSQSYAMGYTSGIMLALNMVSAFVPVTIAITAWARHRNEGEH